MSLLPGVNIPFPDLGPLNVLYGSDIQKPNAQENAIAENLARARVENPGFNKKDEITGEYKPNLAEQASALFGGPSLKDIAPKVTELTNHREATQIREDPENKTVDFSTLSEEDRKNPQKVREHATFQLKQQQRLSEGFDVEDVTSLAGLRKAVNTQTQNEANEKFNNSAQEQQRRLELKNSIQRDIDRETGRLNFDLASLGAQTEQANLDREYLDSRDMREYEYKIQKDDMARMDRVFELILGISKGAF